MREAIFFAAGICCCSAFAMTLSDQLMSSSFMGTQGAVVSPGFVDALSWTQNPSELTKVHQSHVSSGLFLIEPNHKNTALEDSAQGASVLGFVTKLTFGSLGLAATFPLGENVWVDTGSRTSTSVFELSRLSSFSFGVGWAMALDHGWSLGIHVPILFRSNTKTEIYLTESNPWSRARSGVLPYFGWHLGIKKDLSESAHFAVSYREKQTSKIEFSVVGEVDFATIPLPLEASGFSEILFEPRRLDVRYQSALQNWIFGAYLRFTHWESAPRLGLVIDSRVPDITTNASSVDWKNQYEIAVSAVRRYSRFSPMMSYRLKTEAIKDSDDYIDGLSHIYAGGLSWETVSKKLWLSAALRLHNVIGNGELYSGILALDWRP